LDDGCGKGKRERRNNMKSRVMLVFALLVAAAVAAPTALADNNATGSIGTVQVGSTSVDPAAGAAVGQASAAVSAPTTIGGSGSNNASNSIGTAQVGGGNNASNSAGTAQVSAVRSTPRASASVAGRSANASAPVRIGGGGANNASNSIGTAQVGGGNSAGGSIGTVQVGGSSGPSTAAGGLSPRTGVLGAAAATPNQAADGATAAGTKNGNTSSPERPQVLAATTAFKRTGVAAELPFTGLALLLVVLLGLGAVGTGVAVRSRVHA
jgi:hypothetical protein